MPSLTGGSQLDPEYAPWAKAKLSAKEREIIKEISEKEKEVDLLTERIDELEQEIEILRDKCRHRNQTSYGDVRTFMVCVDCGKEHI